MMQDPLDYFRRNPASDLLFYKELWDDYVAGYPLSKKGRKNLKEYLVARRFLESLSLPIIHEIADTFVNPALTQVNNKKFVIDEILGERMLLDNITRKTGADKSFILFTFIHLMELHELRAFAENFGFSGEKARRTLAKDLFNFFITAPTLSLEELINEREDKVSDIEHPHSHEDIAEVLEVEPAVEPNLLPQLVEFLVEKYLLSIEAEGPPLTLEEFATTRDLNLALLKKEFLAKEKIAKEHAKKTITHIKKSHQQQEEALLRLEEDYKKEELFRKKQEQDTHKKQSREAKKQAREARKLKKFKQEQEEKEHRKQERRKHSEELAIVVDYFARAHNRNKYGKKKLSMKSYATTNGIPYHVFIGLVKRYQDEALPKAEKEALRLRKELGEKAQKIRRQEQRERKKKETYALFEEHAIQFLIQEYITREIQHRRKAGLTLRAYALKNNLPYQTFLEFLKEHHDEFEKEANKRIRDAHLAWLSEWHNQNITSFILYMEWARTPIGALSSDKEDLWLTVAEDVREYGLIKPLFAKYRDEIYIPNDLKELFASNADLAVRGEHLNPSSSFSELSRSEQRQIIRTRIVSVLKEFEILELPQQKIEETSGSYVTEVPYLPARAVAAAVLNYLWKLGAGRQIAAEQLLAELFKFKNIRINDSQLKEVIEKLPEIMVVGDKLSLKSDIVLKCANGLKTIKFATLLDGTQPARHEWEALTNKARKSFMHLFNVMCIKGEIANRNQFARLKLWSSSAVPGLYAFKSIRHKLRIICYFHDNDIFLLRVFQKKEDQYKPGELDAADKVRTEHQLRLSGEHHAHRRRLNPIRKRVGRINAGIRKIGSPLYRGVTYYPWKRHFGRRNR